ncbi:MAG: FAD:protein FMN transferase [Pseudomonadota bacterium]|nr:FAD:protein FMN transferase [Pseudomonadota bacterium]
MQPTSVLRRRQLIAAMALTPLVPLAVQGAPAPLKISRPLLGTRVDIVVAHPRAIEARSQIEQVLAHMQQLEQLMSRFDPASQLSLINRNAGGDWMPVAPALMEVLRQARQQAALTGGAFNPVLGQLTPQADQGAKHFAGSFVARMLPHAHADALELDSAGMRARLTDPLARLDLGGIAKLPILAAGLQRLQDAGLTGCLINGGGDVLVSARPDGQPWRIGIRDARQPDRLIAVLPLRAGVVASSGDYERFATIDGQRIHHIIHPATGRPTQGLHGATLVADSVEQVNGLGPAAMVAGPAPAPRRLAQWGVTQALLMGADTVPYISPALRGRLQPPPAASRG